MKPRCSISKADELHVLTASRRRCCLCAFLENNWNEQPGQIAHIDRDRSNPHRDNLAFLCLPHHDRYDSRPSQSKGLTPSELREYKVRLERMNEAPNPPDAPIESGLKLRVTPCHQVATFAAQFTIENTGPRPIRLEAWCCEHVDSAGHQSFVEEVHPTLPRVLRERESVQFFAILDNLEPAQVVRLGVTDSDGRRTFASSELNDRVRRFQSEWDSLAHLRPPRIDSHVVLEEYCLDAECAAYTTDKPALRVQLRNRGRHSLEIRQVTLEWRHRLQSPEASADSPGTITLKPLGSKVGFGNPRVTIHPGEQGQLLVGQDCLGFFVEAASQKVDPESLQLELISKDVTFSIRQEGLPEAILALAKYIVGRQPNK